MGDFYVQPFMKEICITVTVLKLDQFKETEATKMKDKCCTCISI